MLFISFLGGFLSHKIIFGKEKGLTSKEMAHIHDDLTTNSGFTEMNMEKIFAEIKRYSHEGHACWVKLSVFAKSLLEKHCAVVKKSSNKISLETNR